MQARWKVYVVDECHMLSTAAFNALLKTLEEPPPRVVFVLATTDPQRVLATILSRCQRFDFRRIPLQALEQHLSWIADQEQIGITPEALHVVAQRAQGACGMRRACLISSVCCRRRSRPQRYGSCWGLYRSRNYWP